MRGLCECVHCTVCQKSSWELEIGVLCLLLGCPYRSGGGQVLVPGHRYALYSLVRVCPGPATQANTPLNMLCLPLSVPQDNLTTAQNFCALPGVTVTVLVLNRAVRLVRSFPNQECQGKKTELDFIQHVLQVILKRQERKPKVSVQDLDAA